MNSRRKFLLQGGMATTALLATRPMKTFAKFGAPFSSFDGNSILLIHTSGLNETTQHSAIISGLKNSVNCILLDTGNNQTDDHNLHNIAKSLGYDACLTGNPAFSGSLITDTETGNAQSYRIIKKGSARIGLIAAWVNRNKTTTGNPVHDLTAIATKLKEEHKCDLVVCLSNHGYNSKQTNDISIAVQSKNIDVIISSQPPVLNEQLPSIVLNKDKEEVLINNAGHSNVLLGKIEIGFDMHGKKNRINFSNVPAGASNKQLI